MKDKEYQDIMTIKEFASYIHVHPKKVQRMIKEGILNGFKIGNAKTAEWRIPKSEVARMALISLKEVYEQIKKLEEN